jgi:DtxR family Mn-dependent transcriptional regulator
MVRKKVVMYESGENYLETILILKEKKGFVRAIDIAKELNFSKPSVSRAISILKETGHIVVDENGHIELTNQGTKKATEIYDRHKLLTKFLMEIANVAEDVAEEDACKMEHILSDEVYSGIKKYMEVINQK